MAHHGSEEMMKARSQFMQQMELEAQRLELGATGRTPDGSVHETDEGEIRFGIAHDPNKRLVILNFGKPVTWVGMPPEQARDLGNSLIEHSMRCRGIDPKR
jgi:hypothetical protein